MNESSKPKCVKAWTKFEQNYNNNKNFNRNATKFEKKNTKYKIMINNNNYYLINARNVKEMSKNKQLNAKL